MDKAHWTQLRGNPYMTKPSPLMIYQGEERIIKNVRLKGQEELHKADRAVLFDKEYVVSYLRANLLKPLNIKTISNLTFLQDLISEAFHQSTSSESESIEKQD
jgi:hypothetical protein